MRTGAIKLSVDFHKKYRSFFLVFLHFRLPFPNDIVYNSTDPGKDKLIARIEEKLGTNIIDVAAKNGAGTKEYELINID